MPLPSPVLITHDGPVAIITINRPERRNAVDAGTAQALYDAFLAFDADASASVAVLTGAGEHFCSGADLKAIAAGAPNVTREGGVGTLAPTGPSRLRPSKPVIAAIEGYAVAGGLELALWADMRVASQTAVFGVFCRRFGVPLIDLGSIRLPRLIGHSRAMDMILTGRAVEADEALAIGLANRLAPRAAHWPRRSNSRTQSPRSRKPVCAPTGRARWRNGISVRKRRCWRSCAAAWR